MSKLIDENKAQMSNAIRAKIMGKTLPQVPMLLYKVWLSYDLGFEDESNNLSAEEMTQKYQERYDALMPWLNAHNAKECGYSTASFLLKLRADVNIYKELKDQILKVFEDAGIKDIRGIRIYAIVAIKHKIDEIYKELVKSGFVIGKRHETNPWD